MRIVILSLTLFVSAFLLFVCEPIVGKILLPYLGGAAAVWTTCVLFFQVMLLLGYVYAHFVASLADIRKQIAIHSAVLLLPIAFLPMSFSVGSSEAISRHPSLELLSMLMGSAALPFFVVSATAPLLQNWLSRTKHQASSDPYFLYAASNAGSLAALLSYPLAIEPRIGVAAQTRFWFAGYVGLLALCSIAGAAVYRGRRPGDNDAAGDPRSSSAPSSVKKTPPGEVYRLRLYWVAAAFVPSALMLAVTNHIAANVASVPFLWILPLVAYLVTFILAFARHVRVSSAGAARVLPLVLLAVFPFAAAGVVAPPGLNWILIAAHLLLLFIGSLLCHTTLAESRPEPQRLTEFYFWIALGGALGSVFTTILAPSVFRSVMEYPLLVAALPFFRGVTFKRSELMAPAAIAVGILGAWLIFRSAHLDSNTEAIALAHTAFVFAAYKLNKRPRQFSWAFAALMIAYAFILPGYIDGASSSLYATRNFFGVKKVLEDPQAHLRRLFHGDTIHGAESTDPARSGEPLTYYYPGGPVSDVIGMMRHRADAERIAVIGLGTGTMAAYADAAHRVTFYEIDPSVEYIARRYFTFLSSCAANCNVVIGDGRLQLAHEPDRSIDLLMLDAFSSDSVPAHLLSREALQMYLGKLKPGGVLLFHVSNRYLNIEKLVDALTVDAGLVAYSKFDDAGEMRKLGKTSSSHVVAARRWDDLRDLAARPGWKRVTRPEDLQPWTDDYSNLLGLVRWK